MLTFDSMASNRPIRLISPKQSVKDWIQQLIERRETLWFFVWKDLKVQYNKPIYGLIWAIFQPLVYFGIILLVMRVAGRTTQISEMPFALYLISGLTVWNFATSAILGAMNSIQSNAGIITKSFFPRFYLVLAPILKSTIDLVVMLLITLCVAIFLKANIQIEAFIFLPIALLIAWATTIGWASLAVSATVSNRHVRHAIPVLLYAMIFALPVFFSMSEMDNSAVQLVYRMNPIAGSMDFFRAGFGAAIPNTLNLLLWIGQSIIWLLMGILAFRKVERTLADKL